MGGHAWQEGVHGKGACVAGEMVIAAVSTHPTGMHSCFTFFDSFRLLTIFGHECALQETSAKLV